MDAVSWWDGVVGHARFAVDIQKMVQARTEPEPAQEESLAGMMPNSQD